ncbi:hypothetical protein CAPI_07730 [Corynebacterium capitovis DSM 44611]|uniref:helicase-associated domain-containing protein n=1 Tax=Corynebacterium capitovis TaxID=131081 RepID=UPI0003638806|nr:helicase-associated domain-containing protein [Corynebacterium capitovis]WKD58082.1 hypothetical protein CAPI_07730 [Corynebacterium capitovis DSM 44611]
MSDLLTALRAMTDDELRAVLSARPDVTVPTPPSLASLATRLSLPGSVARVVRALNAGELAVLEAAGDAGAELEPIDIGLLAHLPLDVAGAVRSLREKALLYGPDDALRCSPGALATLPAGWRVLDPVPPDVEEKVAQLGPRERQVLDTLASSGGIGTTRAAAADADPRGPIPQLLERGLLVRVDERTVRLPRPVRETLGGMTPRVYPVIPPDGRSATEDPAVDSVAADHGLDAVRRMRQLLTALFASPVPLNKDGSVGLRAVASLSKALGFDPSFIITVGESAGVVGRGNVDGTDVLAATRDAPAWLDSPLAAQWSTLLTGWLASPWQRSAEQRLLSKETHRPEVRTPRSIVVRCASEALMPTLLYRFPVAAAGMTSHFIEDVVEEGRMIGALGNGLPSSPLAAVLNGEDVTRAAAALVPAEVDAVIAQADMTILAPGPMPPEMARVLELFADLESPGLASVYRVTHESVRRALNAGTTAAELHSWLARYVDGEVPPAMSFLIDDTARHHGATRAGAAASYIHSEDPALIALAAQRVSSLRVIAPTVAISLLGLPALMRELRGVGLQPSAEDFTGARIDMAPEPRLVAATPSRLPSPHGVSPAHLEEIVRAVRTADATGATETEENDSMLSTLRAAVRARRHVAIGFVDAQGRSKTLTALPLSATSGQVDVLEESTNSVVRISLPRVTHVLLA